MVVNVSCLLKEVISLTDLLSVTDFI